MTGRYKKLARGTFNGLRGAVVFHLFAAHEHRDVIGNGDTGGDGEGGVGDAADEVKAGGGYGGDKELGDVSEEGGV